MVTFYVVYATSRTRKILWHTTTQKGRSETVQKENNVYKSPHYVHPQINCWPLTESVKYLLIKRSIAVCHVLESSLQLRLWKLIHLAFSLFPIKYLPYMRLELRLLWIKAGLLWLWDHPGLDSFHWGTTITLDNVTHTYIIGYWRKKVTWSKCTACLTSDFVIWLFKPTNYNEYMHEQIWCTPWVEEVPEWVYAFWLCKPVSYETDEVRQPSNIIHIYFLRIR